MKRWVVVVIVMVAVALLAVSCSGGAQGKKTEGQKPAAVSEKSPAETQAREAGGQPAAAPVKKTAEQLLAALPCKLDGKRGVFAAFPENTTAGQICFSLSPVQEGKDIPLFDIKAGGMYFIFHGGEGEAPGEMKIAVWKDKEGKPCVEDSCASEIRGSVENFADPAAKGWTYYVLTPDDPVDLAGGAGVYYGITDAGAKYVPLFY